MNNEEFAVQRFQANLDCRYLVRTPGDPDDRVHVVALHGYGMDAETMLRLVAMWFPRYPTASIQAPHAFYRSFVGREVGFSWSTHLTSEESIRLHHDVLSHVLEATGVEPARRLLIGFSQAVSLNYRYAGTRPGKVHGIIGVCGGVPGDWETGAYAKVDTSLLHLARTEDEFYSAEQNRQAADRLRLRAGDVEYVEMPGAHRFPSRLPEAVRHWVDAKFAT